MANYSHAFLLGIYIYCIVIFSAVTEQIEEVENSDEEELYDIPESNVVEGFGGTFTIPDEDDVLVLNKENFHHVVSTRDAILVEFYAPWCGHCKALEPEYAAAAKELKEDGIRIAKVDVTDNSDLGKEFDVSGYPTIKLFKKGEVFEDFDGPRTSKGIVDYMRVHADPNFKPPPSAVLVLTASNFSSFVNSNEISLVEFYAPWCGHCKKLAPDYEGAAQDLKQSKIPLAKVDATEEKDLAAKHEVRGYPRLFIFRNGRSYDFKGTRNRAGIVDYMREQAKLPSSQMKSLTEVKNRLPRTDPCVFAFFESENDMFEQYIAAANQLREDYTFLHTFNKDLANKYNLTPNSISIVFPEIYYSKFEEKKPTLEKPSGTYKDISSWIANHILPLVGQRTKNNMVARYSKKPLLVVYYDVNFSHQYVKATQFVRSKILPVANEHRDITFAISSEEELEEEVKNFGLEDSGEDVNVAIFGENDLKYPMQPVEDFDSDELEEFVLKYKKGQLKPYLKSQPIPKRQEGPVRTIVAKTFEKEVLFSDKDVLIEFYAPWCGHCKQLEPVYKKVAKHFAIENVNLIVAKMDATANDVHPAFHVQGFPTIFLLKANDKENPVPFTGGERTFNGFKKFINENLSSPSSKDEL